MRVIIKLNNIIMLACFLILFSSCEKKAPQISTLAVTDISETTAKSGGNIESEGDASVVSRGIVWGTDTPLLGSCLGFTKDSTGVGMFISQITKLQQYTQYNVRAFASNKYGTSYGQVQSFKTIAGYAGVVTSSATEITLISATIGGFVGGTGGGDISETGVYWGLSQAPSQTGTKLIIGNSAGAFSANISGLKAGKTYYFMAYVINTRGTTFGSQMSFTTLTSIPVLSTSTPSEITSFTTLVGGNVSDDCGSYVTENGVYISKSANPVSTGLKYQIGTDKGSFSKIVGSLEQATTYYFKAYATNSVGTGYGVELSFKTLNNIPIISTMTITEYTGTSAKVGVNVTNDGGLSVSENGIYWGTSRSPETNGTKLAIGTGTELVAYALK
jgi:hypothetical protein